MKWERASKWVSEWVNKNMISFRKPVKRANTNLVPQVNSADAAGGLQTCICNINNRSGAFETFSTNYLSQRHVIASSERPATVAELSRGKSPAGHSYQHYHLSFCFVMNTYLMTLWKQLFYLLVTGKTGGISLMLPPVLSSIYMAILHLSCLLTSLYIPPPSSFQA